MTGGLSVIIPVLNEADIIEANTTLLVRYLERLHRPFEVILVSNGSTDGTEVLGRQLAETLAPVRCFSLPEPGVGRAFALGVRRAAHDLIVSVDMDLSIDLGFIERAVGFLEQYEIVVGSKKMGSQARALWRRAGSTAFIMTARLLLGLDFKDYSIAAKAYHRHVILRYLDRIDHGTSYVLDIIYHTLSDGGRALEIPVWCEDFRASQFNLMNEAVYRFHRLFILWWRFRVRRRYRRG